MIVFIEGVDGSGKTTLFNKLITLGYKTLTRPEQYEDKLAERQAWQYAFNMYKSKNTAYIADRGPFTELVYRTIKDTNRTYINNRMLVTLLESNMSIIYCHNDNAFDLAKRRGEDNITDELTHKKLTKCYESMLSFTARFTDIPIMQYNWETDYIVQVICFINKILA